MQIKDPSMAKTVLVDAFRAGETYFLSLLLECTGQSGNDTSLSPLFSGLSLTELLTKAPRTHLLSRDFPALLKTAVGKGARVILSSPEAVGGFLDTVQVNSCCFC